MSNLDGIKVTREVLVSAFEALINSKEFTKRIIEADLYNLSKEQFDKVVSMFVEGYKGYFISGGIANIYYKYIINDDKYTAEQLTDRLLEMLKIEDFNKGQ
jgi:hypothetical protein